MKTYIVTFLLLCGVSAVATLLTPGGKTKKYIQFLISCVVLLALFSPFASLSENLENPFSEIPSVDDGNSLENGLLLVTEQELQNALCDRFSLSRDEVLVEIIGGVTAEGDVNIRRIVVTLTGDSSGKREGVRTYLKQNTSCDVEVHVGEVR